MPTRIQFMPCLSSSVQHHGHSTQVPRATSSSQAISGRCDILLNMVAGQAQPVRTGSLEPPKLVALAIRPGPRALALAARGRTGKPDRQARPPGLVTLATRGLHAGPTPSWLALAVRGQTRAVDPDRQRTDWQARPASVGSGRPRTDQQARPGPPESRWPWPSADGPAGPARPQAVGAGCPRTNQQARRPVSRWTWPSADGPEGPTRAALAVAVSGRTTRPNPHAVG